MRVHQRGTGGLAIDSIDVMQVDHLQYDQIMGVRRHLQRGQSVSESQVQRITYKIASGQTVLIPLSVSTRAVSYTHLTLPTNREV